jgi:ABC-type dipeptide/oligopeptide/nickel transport system permease component
VKIDTQQDDHFFFDYGKQGRVFIALLVIFFAFFGVISLAWRREIHEELIWLVLAFPKVDEWFFTELLQVPNSENWTYFGFIPILILFLTCFVVTYKEDVYLYGFKLSIWFVPFIIACSFFWYSYIHYWRPRDDASWEAISPFILFFGSWQGWMTMLILFAINLTGAFTGWQVKELIRIYVKKEGATLRGVPENNEEKKRRLLIVSLIKYIVKRLFVSIFMFVGIIILVWFFIGFIPGDPIAQPLARLSFGMGAVDTEILRQRLLHDFGLDKPWFMQLLDFFVGIFTGNWGLAIGDAHYKTEVFDLIRVWFPRTMEVAIIPMIVVNILAAKFGKYSAVNRGKRGDHAVRGIALMMVSLPAFWVALLFQFLFREAIPAITFGVIDLPIVGLYSTKYIFIEVPYVTGFRTIDTLLSNKLNLFVDTLLHLIVPTLVFLVAVFGHMLRISRSCMLDVIETDYIRTARAKGCSEKDVINRHAFRNALVPYSTFIGFNIGYFISGAAYIEYIFDFNGIGKGMVNAFLQTDYFIIRGCVVIFCFINITLNLAVDVLYAILDPRITYG